MTEIKNMDLESRDVTEHKNKDNQNSTGNKNHRLIKHIPPPEPVTSPIQNMDAAAIAPTARAAGKEFLLFPGEKPACPHISQGVFPHYCDAQGRCHLDFPSEYRHSDIYLEGDPAMKNSLSALCLACVLLATPACKYND